MIIRTLLGVATVALASAADTSMPQGHVSQTLLPMGEFSNVTEYLNSLKSDARQEGKITRNFNVARNVISSVYLRLWPSQPLYAENLAAAVVMKYCDSNTKIPIGAFASVLQSAAPSMNYNCFLGKTTTIDAPTQSSSQAVASLPIIDLVIGCGIDKRQNLLNIIKEKVSFDGAARDHSPIEGQIKKMKDENDAKSAALLQEILSKVSHAPNASPSAVPEPPASPLASAERSIERHASEDNARVTGNPVAGGQDGLDIGGPESDRTDVDRSGSETLIAKIVGESMSQVVNVVSEALKKQSDHDGASTSHSDSQDGDGHAAVDDRSNGASSTPFKITDRPTPITDGICALGGQRIPVQTPGAAAASLVAADPQSNQHGTASKDKWLTTGRVVFWILAVTAIAIGTIVGILLAQLTLARGDTTSAA